MAAKTVTGRALVGWVRPQLRAPYAKAVETIEAEAARLALTALRARVVELGDQPASAVIGLIDDALADA